jgi:hypothetical protein
MTSYARPQAPHLLSSFTVASAERKPSVDGSQAIVNSMISHIPKPARLGVWGYAISLLLCGTYLLYGRARDQRLLNYIQEWVDSPVDVKGLWQCANSAPMGVGWPVHIANICIDTNVDDPHDLSTERATAMTFMVSVHFSS